MQSLRITFTLAASGETDAAPGVSVFWLLLIAIAIIDDDDRREAERRRKRKHPPAGPRPF
ncbi:hypothetical protein FHP25_14700 [Vineibacter terrae]|uniref:Uncharacterized protein n=1 Tax=Vineibacter terrae TaxID=2586908 RepID=A0A5C8PMI8_9HYPH|nr:hypothetical protein [Vineibacter terrae]TXL75132.1 hypothetical protein FHP25_14700 [Vineibacter terrae]